MLFTAHVYKIIFIVANVPGYCMMVRDYISIPDPGPTSETQAESTLCQVCRWTQLCATPFFEFLVFSYTIEANEFLVML